MVNHLHEATAPDAENGDVKCTVHELLKTWPTCVNNSRLTENFGKTTSESNSENVLWRARCFANAIGIEYIEAQVDNVEGIIATRFVSLPVLTAHKLPTHPLPMPIFWLAKSFPEIKTFSSSFRRLHQEIEQFYAHMIPTPTEHATRVEVVQRIENAVLSLWPNSRVEVFGSFRTGLYLPTSDIGKGKQPFEIPSGYS